MMEPNFGTGYTQTDDQPGNRQYVKKDGTFRFFVKQENAATQRFDEHYIDLTEYTLKELDRIVRSYYGNLNEVIRTYPNDPWQIVAEIIAEEATIDPNFLER